jgi:hypothetical protein
MKNHFNIPILFIIFNLLDTTQKVFERIKEAKPKQLFLAGDGPRVGIIDDPEKCQATRKIIEQIINLQNNSQLRNDLQDRGTKLASQVSTKQYIESLIKILDDFQPIREMWSSDQEFIHL